MLEGEILPRTHTDREQLRHETTPATTSWRNGTKNCREPRTFSCMSDDYSRTLDPFLAEVLIGLGGTVR